MTPALKITVTSCGSAIHVTVGGEVDMATSGQLTTAVTEALHHRPSSTHLVLDLTGVTFLDCTGITALLTIRTACTTQDVTMRITGVHRTVGRIITVLHLDAELLAQEPETEHPRGHRSPRTPHPRQQLPATQGGPPAAAPANNA